MAWHLAFQASVFNSASKDCTLKSASAITNPNDFVNGADSSYYFENGCLIPGNRSAAGGGRECKYRSVYNSPTPDHSLISVAFSRLRSRIRLLALTDEKKTEISKGGKASGEKTVLGIPENWGLWSACQFQVGSRRARVRVRNCSSLTKCPDKDIEFDFCST
jgi:hypothetical protein